MVIDHGFTISILADMPSSVSSRLSFSPSAASYGPQDRFQLPWLLSKRRLATRITTHHCTKSGTKWNEHCLSTTKHYLTPKVLVAHTSMLQIMYGVRVMTARIHPKTNRSFQGLGFNNALQEQLFLAHLAYISNRS